MNSTNIVCASFFLTANTRSYFCLVLEYFYKRFLLILVGVLLLSYTEAAMLIVAPCNSLQGCLKLCNSNYILVYDGRAAIISKENSCLFD